MPLPKDYWQYAPPAPFWTWGADINAPPHQRRKHPWFETDESDNSDGHTWFVPDKTDNGQGPSRRSHNNNHPQWPGHNDDSHPEYDNISAPTPEEEIPGEEHHDEKDPFDFFRPDHQRDGPASHPPSPPPPGSHHGPPPPPPPPDPHHDGPLPPPGPPHDGHRGHHGHGSHPHSRHGPHGPHGINIRGGWGGRGRHWGRGGWGPRGRGFGGRFGPGARNQGFFNPFDFFGGMGGGPRGAVQDWGSGMKDMAQAFAEQFSLDPNVMGKNKRGAKDVEDDLAGDVDFEPAVDLFNTQEAYVAYISLPGAKKEDVGLTWDEKSAELNVAGVVTRRVGEEMMQNIRIGERNVGVFRRVVKLGGEGEVDPDAITAKMEDGVLVVRVGKVMAMEDFVEVKKIDIE